MNTLSTTTTELSSRELALVQLATRLALASDTDPAGAQAAASTHGIAAAQLTRIAAEVAAIKAAPSAPAAAAPSLSSMLAGARNGCCS